MTRVALLLVAVLGACTSDRDDDCARIKAEIRASHVPRGQPEPAEDLFARLRKMTFRDREVREAVDAVINATGWTLYTPYSALGANDGPASDRLAKLCHL